jgi:hypothetical protein
MMTWVALAFTTGTLSVPSVATDGVSAGGDTLASPSSACSREERKHLSCARRRGAGGSHIPKLIPLGKKLQKSLLSEICEKGSGCLHPAEGKPEFKALQSSTLPV